MREIEWDGKYRPVYSQCAWVVDSVSPSIGKHGCTENMR